jgi:hypothetical protein
MSAVRSSSMALLAAPIDFNDWHGPSVRPHSDLALALLLHFYYFAGSEVEFERRRSTI